MSQFLIVYQSQYFTSILYQYSGNNFLIQLVWHHSRSSITILVLVPLGQTLNPSIRTRRVKLVGANDKKKQIENCCTIYKVSFESNFWLFYSATKFVTSHSLMNVWKIIWPEFLFPEIVLGFELQFWRCRTLISSMVPSQTISAANFSTTDKNGDQWVGESWWGAVTV